MLVLRATQIRNDGSWRDTSGRLQIVTHGPPDELHVGDEIETVGQLSTIPEPANPGEFDYAGLLDDRGIRCRLEVRKSEDGLTRL